MVNSVIAAQRPSSLFITATLPLWKRRESPAEKPETVPLWTGQVDPPPIGARVHVRMNRLGPGTVTAYAVYEGYLGVMVRMDEPTRPDWHRLQNPENLPGLLSGVEIDAAPLPG